MSAWTWVGIAALGGVGALGRVLVLQRGRHGLLVVNVSGAFALGLPVGAGVHGESRVLLGLGALASFTTFSTWMLAADLEADDEPRSAARLIAVSVVAGLVAVALGRAVGRVF